MNILMIRTEEFPYGSAPAFRAGIMARLMAEAGHNVIVLAKGLNCAEGEIDKNGCFHDFPAIQAVDVGKYGNSYAKAINGIVNNYKIDLVLKATSIHNYFDISSGLSKYHLPVIMDSVEWFDPSNWRLKRLDPRYYLFQFMWNNVFPKADGIIAISRMIENYYKTKLANVVRIPTITDCAQSNYRTKVDSDEIHFIFAGCLDEGKDNILHFVEALDRSDPVENKLFFDIYGPGIAEVGKHLGKKAFLLDKYPQNISVHGKTDQKVVREKCLEADFSVFFRKKRRSANAGFPTKLGECMTMGTPAITNNTGDISLVINSGVNGFMLKEDNADEIYGVLKQIINTDAEHREIMRANARKTGEEFFDYRNYLNEIAQIIETAVAEKKENY